MDIDTNGRMGELDPEIRRDHVIGATLLGRADGRLHEIQPHAVADEGRDSRRTERVCRLDTRLHSTEVALNARALGLAVAGFSPQLEFEIAADVEGPGAVAGSQTDGDHPRRARRERPADRVDAPEG